jgi:hypothetical protein
MLLTSADGRATEERNEPLYSSYSSGYVMLDHDHDLDAEFNTPPQIEDREWRENSKYEKKSNEMRKEK